MLVVFVPEGLSILGHIEYTLRIGQDLLAIQYLLHYSVLLFNLFTFYQTINGVFMKEEDDYAYNVLFYSHYQDLILLLFVHYYNII